MNKCSKCGTVFNSEDVYCKNCGQKLDKEEYYLDKKGSLIALTIVLVIGFALLGYLSYGLIVHEPDSSGLDGFVILIFAMLIFGLGVILYYLCYKWTDLYSEIYVNKKSRYLPLKILRTLSILIGVIVLITSLYFNFLK